MSDQVCGFEKEDGEMCAAGFGLCEEHGYCWSHDPCREDQRQKARKRGGEATAKRYAASGLKEEDLPPLDSPQAAERWCEIVARAVATRRLSHNEGKTIARLIREFIRSHDAGSVTKRLDRLMDALSDWQKTGDPKPVLELVEG